MNGWIELKSHEYSMDFEQYHTRTNKSIYVILKTNRKRGEA
jgi:hypothetical protein